jgi:hypothetical protein
VAAGEADELQERFDELVDRYLAYRAASPYSGRRMDLQTASPALAAAISARERQVEQLMGEPRELIDDGRYELCAELLTSLRSLLADHAVLRAEALFLLSSPPTGAGLA